MPSELLLFKVYILLRSYRTNSVLKGWTSALVTNISLLVNQFGTPGELINCNKSGYWLLMLLVALQKIGYKTYIIFACWVAFETVITYFFMVETRGFTLEELDYVFESKNPRKTSTRSRKVVLDSNANVIDKEDE